ncbi:MAG: mannose-1-phosphate guanylyltransferase [Candidatus Azobacteroides pseudotrichonymphae]|jgi:mannose-1-phosphate guanylyltransferase|uniref:mannose-1-phosphate guanylyltransferase n=1 Tax=Azobacteroides pseudotrichonymphae genomovar. CFP2 TaxID=511995 RepID=B6YQX4_AZOPC|nr:mannose-1-phosphate guanylyltransferase [Candidatus Azobacteroides pseudotrichonymphae]MDR0530005.1 mannose-1-phosphate guanylyltransferase [Bacteroidales bacterium OttesenSCG-928-I14]BAG83596.1 mannose-1-phosphate guanylyltransferase [Candidatus Azobacteroides pseudotrichonymphae genomovar. CFP2]GMO32421.1 MAG: mannose-1-phosphate guanylyltransferase [Candidatus Azobacteroides pseudotrichonymphae]
MKGNYCVIMSGGIGSRFWPFSLGKKPKQFLDFFGVGRSLLQQTFDRFRQIIPINNIFIITNAKYSGLIKEQLPDLNVDHILLEPIRRNTAPCIAYASYRIRSIDPNANIVVSPVDHLILQEQNFLKNIQTGLDFVSKSPLLLTLGIKPTRPETEYGYIQTNEKEHCIRKVKTFTEKPNYELAKIFFECNDFFWNSGIFIWNVSTILEAFDLYLSDISMYLGKSLDKYNTSEEKVFIDETYSKCPNISIDYGIMEKASNVYMLVAEFGWSDLGTWNSLYDLLEKDSHHNASLKSRTLFIESENNLVTLPKDKLAIIQGLNDYIIAESDNILLICKKSEEQRIKQFASDASIKYGKEYS